MSLGELRAQTGLVGLWHFNGNLNDSSGRNKHLTANGTISYSQIKYSQCISATFNGSNNVYVSSFLASSLGTGNIAFYFTFKKSAPPTNDYTPAIMGIGKFNPAENDRICVTIQKNAGYVGFDQYDGTTDAAYWSSKNICDGNLHYVYAERIGNSVKIYVDTILVLSQTTTALNIADNVFFIGNTTPTGTTDYIGAASIDEIAIFNVAKSAAWVRQQYAIGRFGE